MRIQFAFVKCRFHDNSGLLLLEMILTGGVQAGNVLANMIILQLVIRFLIQSDHGSVMVTLGCFVLYQLGISRLYNRFMEETYPKWKENFFYRKSDRMYRILLRSDCAVYQDEAFFRDYQKALQFLEEKMEEGIALQRELLGCFLNGILAVCMYLTIAPGVLPLIFLSFAGSRFGMKRIVEYAKKKRDEQNRKETVHQSYLRFFLSRECAAEGRVLDFLAFFNQRDQDSFAEKDRQTAVWNKRILPLRLGKEFLGEFLFQDLGLIAYLGYCCFYTKRIDIADFAALLNGSNILLHAFSVLFGQMAVALGEQAGYIEAFLKFEVRAEQQECGDPDSACRFAEKIEEVCLSHADFSYGEKDVLYDISMSIRKGEKIAVVGASGAGKTTLVRALAGLGQLKRGRVTVNGREVSGEREAQYRRHFIVLFAENSLFATTLGKNVALSESCAAEKAAEALYSCGLYREGEEIPVNAQVLREFADDGLLFSGGQKQKIVLARTLYHDVDFVIADEAAASLDPFAEDAFNRRILQENTKKGVVVISHRLSVTSAVDCIYVMDHGRIVEKGNHRELLERRGIYARMWSRQTGGYAD